MHPIVLLTVFQEIGGINSAIMERVLQFLNAVFPLDEACSQEIRSILCHRTLKKKEFLLKEGQICRHIYFIASGLLRCYYVLYDHEICSWFMKEGDVIISVESFYGQKPSYESIQAVEDCELYFISYEELHQLYKRFPQFNFIGRVLTEKYYTLWAQQLYALRMQQAAERYRWLLEQHAELILRVPAKYIASYLGIDETTLSRIKTQLRK